MGDTPNTGRRCRIQSVVTAILITATAFWAIGYYRSKAGPGYPLDDTYIHFAFARNVAEGHGFGINAGEPVPGATSPLWVLLLTPGFLFGADDTHWPWILGGIVLSACGIGCAALSHRLARQSGDALMAWIVSTGAGFAAAACFPLVWSAAGAMESPLFGAVAIFALLLMDRAHDRSPLFGMAWGTAVGLAVSARPEGLLLALIFASCELMAGGRHRISRAVVGVVTALVLTVPYGLFCLSTNGRWFPNTYYAKTLSTHLQWPEPAYLWALLQGASQLAGEAVVLAPVALGVLMIQWRRDGRTSAAMAALAFAAILPLSYALMDRSFLFAGHAGNFGRYLHPIFPGLIAIGFGSLGRWAGGVSRLRQPVARALLAIVCAFLCVFTTARTIRGAGLYAHNVRDINAMQVQMAGVLRETLPEGALVAANDVGALAFMTEFRVLDMVGIVSTDVLDALRPKGAAPPEPQAALLDLLVRRQPSALVVFPDWYPDMLATLRPALDIMTEIHVPDGITSGGERLVAYRINWGRIGR